MSDWYPGPAPHILAILLARLRQRLIENGRDPIKVQRINNAAPSWLVLGRLIKEACDIPPGDIDVQ